MPRGLKRFHHTGQTHFVTFTCYHRQPNLVSVMSREAFEVALERVRRNFSLRVYGYVLMPDHVHLLLSEPKRGTLAEALKSLKQGVARRLLQSAGSPRKPASGTSNNLEGGPLKPAFGTSNNLEGGPLKPAFGNSDNLEGGPRKPASGTSNNLEGDPLKPAFGTSNNLEGGPLKPAFGLSGEKHHHFWQKRYYDFNVRTHEQFLEKLHYIHLNPVRAGLCARPEDWPWSTFCHYATGFEGRVEIESEWTARKRERAAGRLTKAVELPHSSENRP